MPKVKSHMKWSWILMVIFMILSIIDVRFGVLGFICMIFPMYQAIRGRGKIHCSHYCPRGSLLGNFLKYISLDYNLPKSIRSKTAKNILLTLMMVVFSISLFKAGFNVKRIGLAVFRFMAVSSIISVIMGIFFKPRSWCQVCPMGHATGLIKQSMDKNTKKAEKITKERKIA
ncbi:4Fe-4S binding domain-containing protein [Caminicella sporogenes DSM 14501]|uniref:4Fe-4S binding domain-containing protein n=1 Tax=Caminicella sporogenes DSM 14501 TaxID=1121266 RepID=A0A1M6S5J1_9FIRM|nr:4Fe-4S binding protein [Caminicella sporogenes]RKD27202.1 4Fe-4S ferredoxin [Caminicella sporogenes]WIF95496.1 4Fe-4S binding protein [Caminicella sporogenes]SHK39950.1 4Fe-4S binding domain-containing protein [Caminicella sporogenes DSM 14501]